MSALISLHTYAVMANAVVIDVSSETTGSPAEHAIAPLEPNFAWQANESSAQHTLTIDLGEPLLCDGYSYIHNETEDDAPSPDVGVTIDVEKSFDGTTWTSVATAQHTDATDIPDDSFDDTVRIKTRYLLNPGSTALIAHEARYWRFTVKGLELPNQYAPEDARISMCWLFQLRQLDRGAAFPVDDTLVFPADELTLPFGKTYRTGHSANHHALFTRTWLLTGTQYTVLKTVMRECNGVARPLLYSDTIDNCHRLCRFESDQFEEELLDVDLYRVTCKLVELPTVQKDGYH